MRVAVGQMPLAEVRRAIARLLEKTRQRRRLRIEPVGHAALMILSRRGKVLMNAVPRRVMPRHHRRAARRADRVEHIELLKIRPFAGQPVKVRRLQPRMPVTRQIAPTPVVGKDEDDVGFGFFCGGEPGQRHQEQSHDE